MKRLDKVIDSVKKIWKDKTSSDSHLHYSKYIVAIDNQKYIQAAEKYGTPQYIIDQDQLIERANFFKSTFLGKIPNAEFFYAMKCNDLPFIVKTIKEQGFNADTAGLFELKLALKLGFKKIIFTSPGKDVDELELVLKRSDRIILNIDNFDELCLLQDVMKKNKFRRKLRVSFRVNPDTTITKMWSKYGIPLNYLSKAVNKVKKDKRLRLSGIHFHTSWNRTPEKYIKKIKIVAGYLEENLKSDASRLDFLDIGGGFFPEDTAILAKFTFKGDLVRLLEEWHEKDGDVPRLNFNNNNFAIRPVDPLENFAVQINDVLERHLFPLNPKIKIFLEPGRFLVTHSTSILTKVLAEKNKSVIVDAGVNLTGDYRFEEFSFAPVVNLDRPSLKLRRKTIYGALCDPSDLWGYSYYGESIKKGDRLLIMHQGAYTYSMSWRFIKPIAKYVAISGKRFLS